LVFIGICGVGLLIYNLVRIIAKAIFKSYFEAKKEFNTPHKVKEENHEV
jgi:hypothetical protein